MRFILILNLLFGSSAFIFFSAGKLSVSNPGSTPDVAEILSVQEKFTFDVRYGFFSLGTVTVTILYDTTYRDEPVHYVFSKIKSNSSIPFIGYKERHYHSLMGYNDTTFYSVKFWTDSIHDNIIEETVYDYDYRAGKVYTFEEGEAIDTLDLDQPSDSGLALFYFARLHAGTDRKVDYPIYINHEKGDVQLQNSSQVELYTSRAFHDSDVEAVRTRGFANLDGPFGFRGHFEAIFKANDLRIPLEARVRVWIGNVRVRLIEYEAREISEVQTDLK